MRWVRFFDQGRHESLALLGGKGLHLAEMTALHLPVPPGFIITTEACNAYFEHGKQFLPDLWDEVDYAIRELEQRTSGRRFIETRGWPLLVSVRSGAEVSMPGMLDTVLNVGLNEARAKQLEKATGKPEFVLAVFQRLIQSFAHTIYDIDLEVPSETQSISDYLHQFHLRVGSPFPLDPINQLHEAITAVFESWHSQKAQEFRQTFEISDNLGTAVIVQQMVFGNLDDESGTGVVFSRDPGTGAKRLYGEYLRGGQGEDVVSGSMRAPSISELKKLLPDIYRQLESYCSTLEQHYQDIQDIEFTVESAKLYILQTRAARRTPLAAIKAAHDMACEGLISRIDAIERVHPDSLGLALSPRLEDTRTAKILAQGIPSSPGAAVGKVAFSREQVYALTDRGDPVILVKDTISPDDVPLMSQVKGIVTREGGATSHAAVVARGQGLPCVVGCSGLTINLKANVLQTTYEVIPQGNFISIDGTLGHVFAGEHRLIASRLNEFLELRELLSWAEELTADKPQVYMNANTAADVAALEVMDTLGRSGILCRTEWMFFDLPFRTYARGALLGESEQARAVALSSLRAEQETKFKELFVQANGRRVLIRLFAAPLDDLLPVRDTLIAELSELRVSQAWNENIRRTERLLQSAIAHSQTNPHFGARGVRLLFARPELMETQVHALISGAAKAVKEHGVHVDMGIMLPWVCEAAEVLGARAIIDAIALPQMSTCNGAYRYQIGALIETPRAALTARKIAQVADFICAGTDALIETTFGYSREDTGSFLPAYVSQKVLHDPFDNFDREGVGELLRRAISDARSIRPTLPIGITGIHANSADALSFYCSEGVDFISVDASHALAIPISLAQAALRISSLTKAPVRVAGGNS